MNSMKFQMLSKEAQIKELAECYSDYRDAQKQIREAGDLLHAPEFLLENLYFEAGSLRFMQKEMGIELVPEKYLTRDTKVFSRKAEWIQRIKEEANAA